MAAPDGGRLAFIGGSLETGGVRVALWAVPAAGGDPQELFSVTRPERLVGLDWTPDGRHLVFGRGRIAAGDERFELWRIYTNGGIRWHSRWINISSALGNEFIALEPIGPALWQLYFGPTTLGWFDEELFVIFDTHGNTGRNPIC